MSGARNHDYQIVPPSIWPFLSALGAFFGKQPLMQQALLA